jgi:hypothetical protein
MNKKDSFGYGQRSGRAMRNHRPEKDKKQDLTAYPQIVAKNVPASGADVGTNSLSIISNG